MDRFTEIETFIQVAETGSFARAARTLQCDPSAVSRAIASLESRLGVRLVARSTRKVTITDIGRVFLARCKRVMQDMSDAEEDVQANHRGLRGRLRVTGVNAVTSPIIMPLIKGFLAQHENIAVELNHITTMSEVVRSEVDVFLHIGSVSTKGLKSIPLVRSRRIVCASPQYLAKHGQPKRFSDLADHECLGFSMNQKLNIWAFREDGVSDAFKAEGRVLASNAELIRQAALHSMGICRLSDFIVGPDIEAGRLVQLFESELDASFSHVCAIVPSDGQLPARTVAFVKYLQKALGNSEAMALNLG